MRHFNHHTSLRILRVIGGVGLAGGLLLNITVSPTVSSPAAVVLNYFSAFWDPDLETVLITWETASELDVSGFQVERAAQSPTSTYTAIGDREPAVGDQLTGVTYGPFLDTETITGTTYWYRLVVYDRNGAADYGAPNVAVIAGNPNTPTPTPTPTATSTPTRTPTAIPGDSGDFRVFLPIVSESIGHNP